MKNLRTAFFLGILTVSQAAAFMLSPADTIPGYAASFNGSAYIDLGNSSDFDFAGSFSLAAGIKVSAFNPAWQAIVTKGDGEWRLHRSNSSNVLSFGTTGLSNVDLTGTTNVNDGNWHFVVAVYDSSTLTKYLYVDGNLDASAAVTGTLATNSYHAYIGENAQVTGRQWQGQIDEVSIWTVALTASQIRSSMHRTLAGNESGLLSYYQMNDNNGATWTDETGAHNGTTGGGAVSSPASSVPVGRGSVASVTGFTSGTTTLGNITLTTTDAFDSAVDLYAFELPLAPNTYPTSAAGFQGNRYWVINAYGSAGTYAVNLTFHYPDGELTASASDVYLFKRTNVSSGSWSSVETANQLASDSVVFNGVAALGQFCASTQTMSYISSTATQNNAAVVRGTTNQQIIGVQVVMSGSANPLSATQFQLTTGGTTSTPDIANARFYYTGTSGTFATSSQFGATVASPSGSFSFTGSQALVSGTNYFWLTYDIASSAATGDAIDATCPGLTVGGVSETPSTTDPSGSRTIPAIDTTAGYALNLDGTFHIEAYSATSLYNFGGSFTVEGWVKPSFSTSYSVVCEKGQNSWRLLRSGTTNFIDFATSGLSNNDMQGVTNVNDGKWHHVAGVYDTSAHKKYLYVDGKLDTTVTITSGTLTTNGTVFTIGAKAGGGNELRGQVDEVRIWNVARTAQQIRESMNRTLAGSETGLVSYYQFNPSAGDVEDYIGLDNGYPFNLGDGVNPWILSTVPIGTGSSNSTSSFTSGTASLGTISMTTTDAFDNSVDLTATQIDDAPNQPPTGSSTILSDRYWVVDAFGTPGTFSVNLQFTVPTSFTANGTASPSTYKLYHRADNGDGTWSVAVTGAASVGSTSVTFNGITSFSQFMIGTDDPLPVEMVSLNAAASNFDVDVRWTTVTEVNNEGFEVQRLAINQPPTAKSWQSVGFVLGQGTTTSRHSYVFEDKSVAAGAYEYRIKQIDRDGTSSFSSPVDVEVGVGPRVFSLSQNYPNPFNPSTTIEFTVPSDGHATLKVYDIVGKEIATLVDGNLPAGLVQRATFDGSKVASGVYFARLQFGQKQLMKKMLLLK